MNANAAFPGELDDVQVAWSGDGSASGSADVDALIASGATTVLTSNTYGGITQEQADALYAAGINVVYMPAIGVADAYDADIVQAVRVVGELLKNAGTSIQYDSQAMASEYVRQHDAALNATVSANNGYTTWLKNGYNRAWLYQGNSGLSGITTSWFSENRYIMAYVDSWAEPLVSTNPYGVGAGYTNTATGIGVTLGRSRKTASMNILFDYYLQHAGVMDALMDEEIYSDAAYDYLDPSEDLNTIFAAPSTGTLWTGVGGLFTVRVSYLTGADRDLSSHPWHTLGDADYPAIIVRTPEIANLIVEGASVFDSPFNPINDNEGCFLDTYEVWVMPSGITGSWVDGTVESFLVAPWACCMYQEGQNLSSCSSYVNDFYSTFFRCGGNAVSNYGTTYQVTCATS